MRQLYIWLFVVLFPGFAFAQVTLEVPAPDTTVTGIGLISGWACEAESITVQFDGQGEHFPLLYGAARGDTRKVCGHDRTGFSSLINWNILGAGNHTAELYINGRPVASRQFTVVTFGESFIRLREGLVQKWVINNWPETGTDIIIGWNEAKQNIEITGIYDQGLPKPDVSLEVFLGTWSFTNQSGDNAAHRFQLGKVYTDEDGSFLGGTLITERGYRGRHIFAEENTVRWFSQPLMDLEVYWIDGSACHMYVFDFTPPHAAEGYYWYGWGSEWDQCKRNTQGPWAASGRKEQ